MSDLFIYWCPRCDVQSQRMEHLCEKGSPLFPQTDERTICKTIPVVREERYQALGDAIRDMLDFATGWCAPKTEKERLALIESIGTAALKAQRLELEAAVPSVDPDDAGTG